MTNFMGTSEPIYLYDVLFDMYQSTDFYRYVCCKYLKVYSKNEEDK